MLNRKLKFIIELGEKHHKHAWDRTEIKSDHLG